MVPVLCFVHRTDSWLDCAERSWQQPEHAEVMKRWVSVKSTVDNTAVCMFVCLQEIESVLFAITSIAEGISVEESVHLPVIFTLLTRIPCNNYSLVNQALYLVGETSILPVAHLLIQFMYHWLHVLYSSLSLFLVVKIICCSVIVVRYIFYAEKFRQLQKKYKHLTYKTWYVCLSVCLLPMAGQTAGLIKTKLGIGTHVGATWWMPIPYRGPQGPREFERVADWQRPARAETVEVLDNSGRRTGTYN